MGAPGPQGIEKASAPQRNLAVSVQLTRRSNLAPARLRMLYAANSAGRAQLRCGQGNRAPTPRPTAANALQRE